MFNFAHTRLRSRARGFSLIELAVVVAIIGILAAIAVPVYLGFRKNAQDVDAISALRNAATAVRAHHAEIGVPPEFPHTWDQVDDPNGDLTGAHMADVLNAAEPAYTFTTDPVSPGETAITVWVDPSDDPGFGPDSPASPVGTLYMARASASGDAFVVRLRTNPTTAWARATSEAEFPDYGGTAEFYASFDPSDFSATPDGADAVSAGSEGEAPTTTTTLPSDNEPPVLAAVSDQEMFADTSLEVEISASDADDDLITLAAPDLVAFGEFVDNGDGTGLFTFAPGPEDIGPHLIDVTASDDEGSDSIFFTLTVSEFAFAENIVFTSNGVFSPADYPAMTGVRVRLVGGGGAGGGALATAGSQGAVGSGGGAGGYAEGFFSVDDLPANISVTVGSGGAGASGLNGTAGGTSSFGALLGASGGDGGARSGAQSNNGFFLDDTSGGSGLIGDLLVGGGAGRGGFVNADTSQIRATGGAGGSSVFGAGGPGVNSSTTGAGGADGQGFGAGGSGAANSANQAARAGGDGTDGVVVVEVIYSGNEYLYLTSSTTFDPADYPGLEGVRVQAVGGGGAGGGTVTTAADRAAAASGGGAGGYAEAFLSIDDLSGPIAVSIGAGGSGGTGVGGSGDSTSFGGLVVATGGSGGGRSSAQTNNAFILDDTAAGIGTTGDLLAAGQPGRGGFVDSDNNHRAAGGAGGNSAYGAGGPGVNSASSRADGKPGVGFGAGGSGGASSENQAAAASGGDGTSGVVILELAYTPQDLLVLTSSTTFDPADHPGLAGVRVRALGGGGAGGGALGTGANQGSTTSGGGAGGYAEALLPVEDLGAGVAVTIGSGGSAPSGLNGGAGGATSFGALVAASGGSGGARSGVQGTNGFILDDTPGGVGTAGDLLVPGGVGTGGYLDNDFQFRATGGGGGSSFLLGGAPGSNSSSTTTGAGDPGRSFGAGGGGSANSANQSAQSGGVGSQGVVILDLYFLPLP